MSTALIAPQKTTEQTAVERWNADRTRTTVEFEVKHLWGLHTVRGRFRSFDGAYIVGPGGTEIELTIDAASIDTGVARRDEHLRSPDFFFVALHPQVRFRSTRVTRTGKRRRAHERRAGGGRHDRSSRVRRIGARDRRRARDGGDYDGRPGALRDERGPAWERPAADEGAREGAPRPRREPLLIRRAGRGGSGRPPRGRGLAARPVSV